MYNIFSLKLVYNKNTNQKNFLHENTGSRWVWANSGY